MKISKDSQLSMARVMDIPIQLWPIVLPKNLGQTNTLRFISASNKFQQTS
jgi:hypothetical protein